MKKFMLIMLLFAGGVLSAQNDFHNKTVMVLPSSELTIDGDTNISKFQCEFDTSYLSEENSFEYGNSFGNNFYRRDFDPGDKRF